jgi:hypothetical protein
MQLLLNGQAVEVLQVSILVQLHLVMTEWATPDTHHFRNRLKLLSSATATVATQQTVKTTTSNHLQI